MNYRGFDLNLLMVLDALLKERNATLVGQKLGVSQPTVSCALKKLREAFGDALFVRTAAGMVPTAKALDLADPVARVIAILQSEIFNAQDFDPATSHRTFVINTTDIGEMVFLPPLLKRLGTFAPYAKVECVCLEPDELAVAMNAGRIDLAIGYLPELDGGGIFVQSLFEHPFVCLARADHPHIGASLTLEQYKDAHHIELVGSGHSQQKFEAIIKKQGVARQIAFRSQHFMNIPFLVRDSDLIATVPKVIATAFAQVPGLKALRPPFDIPPIPIKQYWHQVNKNDFAQIWLRKTISDLFLGNDPTARFDIP